MKWLLKTKRLAICFGAALIVAVIFLLASAFKHPTIGFWLGNVLAFAGLFAKEGIEYMENHDSAIDFFDFLSWLIGIGFIDCVILFQYIFV